LPFFVFFVPFVVKAVQRREKGARDDRERDNEKPNE